MLSQHRVPREQELAAKEWRSAGPEERHHGPQEAYHKTVCMTNRLAKDSLGTP
jgi:hypothetical protein